MFAALLALASAAAAPQPPKGVELASAQVTVEILRPAIMRQSSGPQETRADAPRPQVTRREGATLIEFQ